MIGWLLDLFLGDPAKLPHPVVGFGKIISYFEKTLNNGGNRKLKGAITAGFLIFATFVLVYSILFFLNPIPWVKMFATAIGVFYCLAGTTLIREVKAVFAACDRSLEEGRKQVARIVGRDTANLTDKEVKTAALETLAENLSDGVIAPLFWYALLGLPGMMAYKMINTLDSMIGYKNKRYGQFGW
ncbi:MAG: cobalamin biosynthesis protein, partial [Lachnospiraceae bacterium]|nr:cobalamin biosynthesis protein [Lachnospiraceae bacterium]